MSAIPGGLDTERGPPMTLPLRHFLVALGFLLAGVGLAVLAPVAGYGARVAHIHLLLAGWICLTILGAMTQFVPVWSGVALHSRALAHVQLVLVTTGIAGLSVAFLSTSFWLAVPAGVLAAVGFWTFCYNLARTLARARPLDVTEGHFALALAAFSLVPALGLALAVDLAWPVFAGAGLSRYRVVSAHATLAVFGAVLPTVAGALYQLATMFTNTDLSAADRLLQRAESGLLPGGAVLLAVGRLLGVRPLAQVGGLSLLVGVAALALVVAHRLLAARVGWTPMLRRYAVVAVALLGWALWTAPAWIRDPLAPTAPFGPSGAVHLLALGGLAAVVLGTLYHIVPFLVWVRRYSDRVGLEPVPMVDDLYDSRLALADFWALVAGSAVVVGAGAGLVSGPLAALGPALVAAAVLGCVANLLLVLRRHARRSLAGVLGLTNGVARRQEPREDAE